MISIPLRYNLERIGGYLIFLSLRHFNSTKVQFGVTIAEGLYVVVFYFNSTKVQFGEYKGTNSFFIKKISIPLRYNLERQCASTYFNF